MFTSMKIKSQHPFEWTGFQTLRVMGIRTVMKYDCPYVRPKNINLLSKQIQPFKIRLGCFFPILVPISTEVSWSHINPKPITVLLNIAQASSSRLLFTKMVCFPWKLLSQEAQLHLHNDSEEKRSLSIQYRPGVLTSGWGKGNKRDR